VTPQIETFTAFPTLNLYNEGTLTLQNGCKGYSSYVTLYAISTTVINVTSDYVPSAPMDFKNCFEDFKSISFENLPLHAPLVNVMSSVDDLE
jgi:hypothetical protein